MILKKNNQLVDLCEAVATLSSKYGKTALLHTEPVTRPSVDEILAALDGFMECVRYLNTRRSDTAILHLNSESAVQDALYLMLRPWILDLVGESPSEKIANRYSIKDFVSHGSCTVIEAKYVRNKEHGKLISKELHDDIETYRHHPACDHLIFFIYDPAVLIPDKGALDRQISIQRTYNGVPLHCHLVVKP